MGAWGATHFANDAALDFAATLAGVDILKTKLAQARAGDPPDADLACEILAAADVVAAMTGRPGPDLPEEIEGRLAAFGAPDAALVAAARAAVAIVRERSELAELWAEAGDGGWEAEIADLLARLDPQADYTLRARPAEPTNEVQGTCFLCERDAPGDAVIELTHKGDGHLVFSTIALYAHRRCVEARFEGPHWERDGAPSERLLNQFRKLIGAG